MIANQNNYKPVLRLILWTKHSNTIYTDVNFVYMLCMTKDFSESSEVCDKRSIQ